jgi:hypothetical protein
MMSRHRPCCSLPALHVVLGGASRRPGLASHHRPRPPTTRRPTTRHDAGIVLDERQNFRNLPYSIEDMLAEARGFAVSIALDATKRTAPQR